MADIVDAFVVSLGLDARDYQREIKNYRDDRKRLSEEDERYNRDAESAQRRMVQGVRTLRNETVGFLFALSGASSIKSFASDLISGDAATGRLAKNLGLATQEVSAWEGAIKRVGGSADSIQGALRTVSAAFQSLQLTGSTGNDADFQGLGVNARDLQNPQDALLKISEASSRMSRPEFNNRLGRLGFDEATINLLAKGRAEVTRMLEEQRKLGVATDQDAEAAQRFQERLAAIESTITAKVRPALMGLVDQVGTWLEDQDNLNGLLATGATLIGAIGIAAAIAYWPFTLLAGAVLLVATNLDKLKAAWNAADNWWQDLGKSTDPFFDPIRKAFGMQSGADLRAGKEPEAQSSAVWARGPDGTWSRQPSGADASSLGAGGLFARGGGDPFAWMQGAAGSGAIRSGSGSEDRAMKFFTANGYTATQARGIVAAMKAENGSLDPSAFNPAGGGQGAYGLGQWRGSRLRSLRAKYGNNPTFDQQLQFFLAELDGPDGMGAGSAIRGSNNSSAAARAAIDKFYRPGAGTAGDYARAGRYLGAPVGGNVRYAGGGSTTSSSQSTSIGQITIYTAATDAKGIAHDLRGALAQRGVVNQANTGLQP